MVRGKLWQVVTCVAVLLAGNAAWAGEDAQELLDKATDTKLAAESVADLNQVIDLCQQALAAGLDESNTKFANSLLASTLTQRAELVCLELFERPVTPNRGRRLVQLALTDLEKTISLDADQVQAQFLIGRLYAHLGEQEKALKALDAAVRLADADPAMKAKALLIRANVQPEVAQRQADFDAAAKLAPKDANILRFRGLFYLSQNNLEMAISDLNAAVALEPQDADSYEALGIALSLAQKYDDAMEKFSKAIELEPDAPASYIHRARVRALKNDAPGALRDVEQALKIQPGSVQALHLHATLLAGMGKFEAALTDMNLLRQAMPNNPEILLQIGALYQASKQPHKAVTVYNQVLEADPQNLPAYRGRADAYLSLARQPDAAADYRKALELEPKNSGVLNNLAWILATSPDEKLRNGKEAIEMAKLACEVTEYKAAHILSTLAASYAETGDFDTAINWSQKAVEMGSDQLKGQLKKELESYQAKKPWREAEPPEDGFIPEDAPQVDKSVPADRDTAEAKRGT